MSPDADKLASAFGEADEAVDLSDVMPEAWLALAFFWLLGLTVLYQFITRYVFNDSAAWTEEIARYFLIALGPCDGLMHRPVAHRFSWLRQLVDLGVDAENGQLPNDHRQSAHELGVRRGVAGICVDDLAWRVGHAPTYSPRLQRA